MNAPHLHLILTHIPVLGAMFSLGLLILGLCRSSEELKRAALLGLVAAGLFAIPAYITGEPAAEHLKKLFLGKVLDSMDQHAEIAIISLSATLLLGLVSACALIYFRRGRRITRSILFTILAIGILDGAALAWTANLGGAIRHTETHPSSAN